MTQRVFLEPRLCACDCGQWTKGGYYYPGHNPPNVQSIGYVEEDRGYKTPCHIWQGGINVWGYAKLGRNGKTMPGHRWYYEQVKGPIPDGMDLDHLCRVRRCVNPDHMEPVPPIENKRRGRVAKLSHEDIKAIEERYRSGESQHKLAKAYGVHQPTISKVLNVARWAGVAAGVETRSPVKLTEVEVAEILRRRNSGETYRSLANAYNIGMTQVGRIVKGESWKGVAPMGGFLE